MSVFLSLSQPEHAFQRITKSESIMHVGNVAVSKPLQVPRKLLIVGFRQAGRCALSTMYGCMWGARWQLGQEDGCQQLFRRGSYPGMTSPLNKLVY